MKVLNMLLITGLLGSVSCNSSISQIKAEKKEGKLVISAGQNDLLSYQYEIFYPPEGVDSVYKRSGFIHPLKTPSGKVITRINPEGHYHHYGIWNPWTHVLFEGDTLDFWNLYKNEGTVRFAGFEDIMENEKGAGYRVLHEHVVLKDGMNKVVLNEVQTVRISEIDNDQYTLDFKFEYTPATESEFKILEYRYGGFGWRTTSEWSDSTSSVLTSEGIGREGADGSLVRWVIIQGQLGEGSGGAVLVGHPDNENHPEPIRVWPDGDLFMTMLPTKLEDWILEAGNNYTLKYRMVIFDGEFTSKMAEKAWSEYQ